jgi:Icc-related predicted phosphoesterase
MSLKIVAISDTHSYHRQLVIPDGDVLVHAGDLTFKGELSVIEDFADWIKALPHKHKVVIFGNHELGFQYGPKRPKAIKMIEDAGAIYLEDSATMIDGIKFYGSPVQPFFHNWEFNYQRGKDIAAVWAKIPTDTNILITHGPPYMILDGVPKPTAFVDEGVVYEHVGCKDLLERIADLPHLKAHIFGHIHAGYGTVQVGPTTMINAASCTEGYAASNPPIVFEVNP